MKIFTKDGREYIVLQTDRAGATCFPRPREGADKVECAFYNEACTDIPCDNYVYLNNNDEGRQQYVLFKLEESG